MVEGEEEGSVVVAAVGVMLGGETVECWRRVRDKLILALMRCHQFCQSNRSGNMRRWRRSRERSEKGRVWRLSVESGGRTRLEGD